MNNTNKSNKFRNHYIYNILHKYYRYQRSFVQEETTKPD